MQQIAGGFLLVWVGYEAWQNDRKKWSNKFYDFKKLAKYVSKEKYNGLAT